MIDAINSMIATLLGSSWALLAIGLISAVDAFLPVVPSDAAVVAAGALSAHGKQATVGVFAVAAVGAFVGDHISYALGRILGVGVVDRLPGGNRVRKAQIIARRAFQARGGMVLVALRFVPGGRTATTLTAGITRYSLVRFTAFDAVAAILWAGYTTLIGYFVGRVVAENHVLAVGIGVGISVAVASGIEGLRVLWRRRRRRQRQHQPLVGAGRCERSSDGH